MTSSSLAMVSATCCACVASSGVEVRCRGDDLVADAVELGAARRRGTPPPGRSGCARPARTARGGSRPAPRRGSRPRPARAVANASAQPSASSTNQTPLPSYPPRVVLRTHGKPERPRPPRRRRRRRCAGTARRARPAAARITALSCACTSASGPGPRRDARRPASACRCSVGTCSWSKVTTCAPLGDLPEHLEVAVVADDAVRDHLRRRDALGLGQQPQRDAGAPRPARPSSGPAVRHRSRRSRGRGRARTKQ